MKIAKTIVFLLFDFLTFLVFLVLSFFLTFLNQKRARTRRYQTSRLSDLVNKGGMGDGTTHITSSRDNFSKTHSKHAELVFIYYKYHVYPLLLVAYDHYTNNIFIFINIIHVHLTYAVYLENSQQLFSKLCNYLILTWQKIYDYLLFFPKCTYIHLLYTSFTTYIFSTPSQLTTARPGFCWQKPLLWCFWGCPVRRNTGVGPAQL